MKKTILFLAIALATISCNNNTALIKGSIKGLNLSPIIVSRLEINTITILDTIKTDKSGNFKYKVKFYDKSPQFYYLSYNRNKLSSLIVKPKDKITIETDSLGNNLVITNSAESSLLADLDAKFLQSVNKFDSLSIVLAQAMQNSDEQRITEIKRDLGRVYVKQKQNAIKSIMQNPYSFSNISALYQQFNPQLPVFAEFNDGLIFSRVYDSLKVLFPQSPYLRSLKAEVDAFENRAAFNARLENAGEQIFPNIILPDTQAAPRALADLLGRPFILYFWTSTDIKQKLFNRELIDIYNKYKANGLEIYQVCVDIDKTAWATAVKEQGLPWINVCDGKGANSQGVLSYNVSQVPTMFIFDKSGTIVSKNIFDSSKLSQILSKL